MKSVFHKKNCNWGSIQVYANLPLIMLFKSNNDTRLDNYCVRIKLRRDTMWEKSYIYEFKMALFVSGEAEEFLLFVCNLQMTLEASRTIADGVKIQYIHTLVRGEALQQLEILSFEVGSTTTEN